MKPLKILYIITIIILFHSLSFSQPDFSHPLEGPSDWPMYQYNAQHTGYNDKAQITLPLDLLWSKVFATAPVPIEPVTVIGDRIIVTNEASFDPAIRSINALTGEIDWIQQYRYTDIAFFDQAVYFDGSIYILEASDHLDSMRIAGYDLETGNPFIWYMIWSQGYDQLGSIVHKGKLIFPSGYYNGIQCVDLEADTTDWWNKLGQLWYWSPAAHDSVVYVWLNYTLIAYELASGRPLWHTSPEAYDTVIYVTDSDSDLFDFDNMQLRDKINYSQKSNNSLHGFGTTACIDTLNKMIYMNWYEGAFGFNYETRRRIWRYDYNLTLLDDLSSPATCNGVVYMIIKDELFAFSGIDGEILFQYKLDSETEYSPVIADGLLFVSTKNKTLAFDIESYNILWEYPAGGYITIANNKLFLASYDGKVYAFGQIPTSVGSDPITGLPIDYQLSQNYPNPFKPETKIQFSIPETANVNISIYNVLGQKVRTLTNRIYPAGNYILNWDGKNDSGSHLPSGVYFYNLTTEGRSISKKMILLK